VQPALASPDAPAATPPMLPVWRANLRIYARLTRLVWRYPWYTTGAVLSLLLSTGCALLVPALLAWVVDVGVRQGSLDHLALAAGAILGVSLLRGTFAYGQGYLSQAVSQWVAYDLRLELYDQLQRLSFSYHDDAETGDVMSRLTVDIEAVRNFIVLALLRAALAICTFLPIAVILIVLDPPLALLTLASVPVLAFLSVTVARRLVPLWGSVQAETGALSTVMQESLAGIRVVKTFTREEHQIARFNDANRVVRSLSLAAMRTGAWNQPLMIFVLNVITVAVLWIGGTGVIGHRLSLGTLVAVMQYVLLLGTPVRTFGFMVNWFTRGLTSGKRLFDVLDLEPAIQDAPGAVALPEVRGHVRFDHVSFRYGDGPMVIDDVNIDARPGEVIALLGATGSGKSTILHLLPRFYDVTSGRITIDGVDVREMTLASLRGAVGLVLQDVFLFNATLRENIAYGVEHATEEQIVAASRAARVHEFAVRLPDGYETLVGERGVSLSGGQKQRLAIARTLLRNPRVLVLDDSTSSVDMETEYLIQQALQVVMRGRTTFVVASRLRTIKNAHQILVLDHGRIVERGTHDMLLAKNGQYRRLYDLQLREQEEAERQTLAGTRTRQGKAG
jgi:ABC-type multidrug transport system fused ATPase/permease subunit